jgi:hypothetical protein
MVTFGSVKEREFTLIEQGEYILTLNELDESTGQYGDRLIWKFLVSLKEDPTGYICRTDGNEKTVWTFTDVDIILGSLQHELVEKLTGRPFVKDSEPPSEDDLLGRRVIGYITHHTPKQGKNAGKKQEQIVAGSIKAFKGPQPNKVIAPNVSRPAPTEEQEERAELITRIEKQIGKAVTLNTPHHVEYVALDLNTHDDNELLMLLNTIKAEVAAALDD